MFDLSGCHVERSDDGDYELSWHTSRPGERVDVYMADHPDVFYVGGELGAPLLSSMMAQVRVCTAS